MTLPRENHRLYEFVKPLNHLLQIRHLTIIPARCVDLYYGSPTHKLCWHNDPPFDTMEKS